MEISRVCTSCLARPILTLHSQQIQLQCTHCRRTWGNQCWPFWCHWSLAPLPVHWHQTSADGCGSVGCTARRNVPAGDRRMNKYLPLYSGFQLYLILLIITNACSSNSELKLWALITEWYPGWFYYCTFWLLLSVIACLETSSSFPSKSTPGPLCRKTIMSI